MNVNVYKIENHLVLTGPGSKLIKDELKQYNGRWQPAPFNLWLIPDTKSKSFMKDKKITSKVIITEFKPKSPKSKTNIEEKPLKTEKKENIKTEIKSKSKTELENNFNQLPSEIISEIVNHVDAKTLTSLITSTKQLSKLSSQYQNPIQRQALERELKHVNHKRRHYYSSEILDLKVNDRVIYNHQNYKIVSITGNKGGKMVHVDMLGNVIGNELNYSIIKREGDWGVKKIVSFFWGTPKANNKPDSDREILFNLQPGILQYDNGPEITNSDSHYLKYKTIPSTQETTIPELHTMVTVKIYKDAIADSVREYEINNFKTTFMSLQYAGSNEQPILDNYVFEKFIIIHNLRNGYKIKQGEYTYEMVKIGGFGESDYTYNPY